MPLPRAILLLSISALAAAACGTDVERPTGPPPSEHGRWGVEQAFRNRQETHMIDVAYFEFDTARMQLTTNFTGEETVIDYRRDERGIQTPGNPYFERMDFESLTDSSLVIAAEVAGYFFDISLSPRAQRIDRTLVTPEE